MDTGKLTVVPTPVGNLGDITLRGLEVLKEADLILAEDTRTSSVLLKHFDIHKPLESHHKFNEFKTSDSLVTRIVNGLKVALISDAGTPGISDPGSFLIKACIEQGVEVDCLPGATAFVPALIGSGFSTDKFVFEGFLPQKKGRKTRITYLSEEDRTIIIYESPYRVLKTLQGFAEIAGTERRAVACREISKVHQEFVRGTIGELITHFTETAPRGEFVLIIEGKSGNGKGDKSKTEKEENRQNKNT